MFRLAWLTDIHLNFVPESRLDTLCRDIREAGADAILLGGDIAEAPVVAESLQNLDARLGRLRTAGAGGPGTRTCPSRVPQGP